MIKIVAAVVKGIILISSIFQLYAGGIDNKLMPPQNDTVLTNDSVLVVKLASVTDSPQLNKLPIFYLEKNQICKFDSKIIDTSGAVWFHIFCGLKNGWVSADNVRLYTLSEKDSITNESTLSGSDADRKRRTHFLIQHQEWPRRIQKAVKDGKICLDMTTDQLIASWGESLQKSTAFLLGSGKYEQWIYKDKDGKILIVNIIDGKIAGWSL